MEAFLNAAAHKADETQNVAGGSARLGNDVVGIAVADDGASDLGAHQGCLLQKRRGAQPRGIAKNPSGGLKAEGLGSLALDPGFAHAFADGFDLVGLQLEVGGNEDRVIEVAAVLAKAQLVAFTD